MTKLQLIEKKIRSLPEKALDDIEKYIDKLLDEDHEEWTNFSTTHLSRSYSEDEPDYSDVSLKEPNPNIKSG